MIRTTSTPATPSPTPSKRSLRCLRCTERKFRTPRDLALHILSKHGEIQLPVPSEDTRSVTLNSPFRKSDIDELDQLVEAASIKSNDMLSKQEKPGIFAASHQPVIGERNTISSSPIRRLRRLSMAKRSMRPSRITKRRSSYYSETSDENIQSDDWEDTNSDANDQPRKHQPAEGESTGPRPSEVFLARCRAGRVPLVPIQLQPSVTLNFIDGLF